MAALRLQHERFDYIYCSDLNRTIQTSEIICEFHKYTGIYIQLLLPVEIKLDARLREKSGGTLEGLPLAQFKKEADVIIT